MHQPTHQITPPPPPAASSSSHRRRRFLLLPPLPPPPAASSSRSRRRFLLPQPPPHSAPIEAKFGSRRSPPPITANLSHRSPPISPTDRRRSPFRQEHPWLVNASSAPNIPLGDAVRARLKQFSVMNKFKKKALRVLAEHLPGEEVASIKQTFQMMDTDKNGNLTLEELKKGLQIIGENVTDPDVLMLMEARRMERSSSGVFSLCLKLYPGRYESFPMKLIHQ